MSHSPPYRSRMIVVSLTLAYPWGWDAVAFTLWPGYGRTSAAEALEWIRGELDRGEVVEILDGHGEPWAFYGETVRAVVVLDGSGCCGNPGEPRGVSDG